MAWPNPFKRRKENTCTAWGYSFQVTPQHLTKDETASMKVSYDTLGEAALERLNVLYPPGQHVQRDIPASGSPTSNSNPPPPEPQPRKRDLFELLRDHASEDETLSQLWGEANSVPEWVCWEQLARAQEIFYRYGGPALTGLAFQSLLGGMVQCRLYNL